MDRNINVLQVPSTNGLATVALHDFPRNVHWSAVEDKCFERALAQYKEICSTTWDSISALLPGKTPDSVRRRYELLAEDIRNIEAGRVPLPQYNNTGGVSIRGIMNGDGNSNNNKDGIGVNNSSNNSISQNNNIIAKKGTKPPAFVKNSDQERRKGIPWTEEEHRQFLLGLNKFGKGDWRSISRNFVISRTPTQVASHAQKYFIRLNSMNKKDKRRSSIHDITSVGDGVGDYQHNSTQNGTGVNMSNNNDTANTNGLQQHGKFGGHNRYHNIN